MAVSYLYPIESATRAARDLSGIWRFQIDREEIGLASGWRSGLPKNAMPMAVPSDWRALCVCAESETHTGAVWFETEAFLPMDWQGKELLLWFEGAPCPTAAWVNGAEVVRDAGSKQAFAGKLNGAAQCGQICKIVVRTSGAVSGIYRPVKLLALPAVSIRDISLQTEYGGGNGKISFLIESTAPQELSVELYDAAKQLVASASGREGELCVPCVQVWEPESPMLYTLRVLLHDGTHLLDEYLMLAGVREVKINENRVLINRRPFYFKGFCIAPSFTDSSHLVQDFNLLRWVCANTIYATWLPEEFLRMADREGMLVLCPEKTLPLDKHPCIISLPENVFACRNGEASPALEVTAMRNWLENRSSLSAPIILSGYGTGAVAGNRCVSCKRWSEEYQSAYVEAQNTVIDDCESAIGELLPFIDGQKAEGIFTQERQPKAAAYMIQKRWKRLDSRTHKY